MEVIREEDRGTETMVFEMTSIQLNAELQFCLGNAYEHNGKDRYNVYLVKNGRVHGTIGHYDVPQGELTVDAGGKDFDVMKYKEPSWLIDPSFHLLEKGKPDKKEPEKSKEKLPPKPKSLFRVIITTTNGDCFYDSIVRSENGNNVEEYNVEKVRALRNRIGEYITTTGKQELLDKYHYSVKFLSNEEIPLKDDPYYARYYKMMEDGESKQSIIEKIKEELSLKPKLQEKLNVETFDIAGPNDPTENVFSEEEDKGPARAFLHDYFNDEMELNDIEIPDVFLENIEKDEVWASELIIVQMEQMLDVKFLLLTKNGSTVEEYNAFDLDTYKAVGANTRFILADYTPLSHFKLIVHKDKKQFKIVEVPDVIKAKFAMFKGQEQPVVVADQDAQQEKLETPAVESPEESQEDSQKESQEDSQKESQKTKVYTKEQLSVMKIDDLKKILVTMGLIVSGKKEELVERILSGKNSDKKESNENKEYAEANLKKPEFEHGKYTRLELRKVTNKANFDEIIKKNPNNPLGEYRREDLEVASKKVLDEILKTNVNLAPTPIQNKGLSETVDCILNPELEKCNKSKKNAKKGGKFTRRI